MSQTGKLYLAELFNTICKLNDRLEEWEMKADWQKTRVMRIGRKQDVCNVEVNG